MNLDDLTISQARQLAQMFGTDNTSPAAASACLSSIDNGMIGKYVIVRCKDAGVHAGILKAYNGRECLLKEARRLWYFKPANGAAFLSGVATEGLHSDSKVGAPIDVHLTENCEIILCADKAARSIAGADTYVV